MHRFAFVSKLEKRFSEILSEGKGVQLFWLVLLICAVLLVFWAITSLVFKDGSLQWQDLVALVLDPGCFGGAGAHDIFRLIVTICGLFLFSALLISVVSNIFENISESFRSGRSRYSHKGHVLILGGEHHILSMIPALLEEDSPYKEDIVILTNQDVETLKNKVFSLPLLDREKTAALRRRLTVYRGERDNEGDLARKDLARNAAVIYVIGEEHEHDSDSISLRCCEKLKGLCQDAGRNIRCFLLLRDSASVKVFKKDRKKKTDDCLKVDVVDAAEYLAERVLIPQEGSFPAIDYTISRNAENKVLRTDGIQEGSSSRVRFVVVGMTDIAQAMALTAARICHFPNYREKGFRTVISFIDADMALKMSRFVASYDNLFELSHYRFISFDAAGSPIVQTHTPNPAYGDFLDIEWEFFDADISDPGVRKCLEGWASEDRESLSFAICLGSGEDNTRTALSLPYLIYQNGYPIFVYQEKSGEILTKAKATQQFGELFPFGMATDPQSDPLFEKRTLGGQRVNFAYSKDPDELTAWFKCIFVNQFSSIYSANSLPIINHNFGLLDKDIAALTDEQWIPICDEEHRRWMISNLLMGYRAPTKEIRTEWTARATCGDSEKEKEAGDEKTDRKNKEFLHMNIAPYDELIPEDQKLDRDIIEHIRYIMLGE